MQVHFKILCQYCTNKALLRKLFSTGTENTVLLERVTSRIHMFPNWPVAKTGIQFKFNELNNILYVGPHLKAIAIIEL